MSQDHDHDHGHAHGHGHVHSHGTETEGKLSPFLARQRYKKAAVHITEKDTVLDVGCGAGGFQKYLPKITYYGVDAQKHWDDDDNLFVGSIGKQLPKELESVKFTVVVALAIIEHLDKPGELFKEASVQLKKGGKVILTTPHPMGRKAHDFGAKLGLFSNHASDEHESFLDKGDLKKFAEDEGFEMISYRRFLGGMNQVAVFRKV